MLPTSETPYAATPSRSAAQDITSPHFITCACSACQWIYHTFDINISILLRLHCVVRRVLVLESATLAVVGEDLDNERLLALLPL